jgi:hypothetical protein
VLLEGQHFFLGTRSRIDLLFEGFAILLSNFLDAFCVFFLKFHEVVLGEKVVAKGHFFSSQQFVGGEGQFPLVYPFELPDSLQVVLLMLFECLLYLFLEPELFLSDLQIAFLAIEKFPSELLLLLPLLLHELVLEDLQAVLHRIIDLLYRLFVLLVGLLELDYPFPLDRHHLQAAFLESPLNTDDVSIAVDTQDRASLNPVDFASRLHSEAHGQHGIFDQTDGFAPVQLPSGCGEDDLSLLDN